MGSTEDNIPAAVKPHPFFFGHYPLLSDKHSSDPEAPNGGVLFLGKYILLPEAHGLLIGFVADPTKLSFDK